MSCIGLDALDQDGAIANANESRWRLVNATAEDLFH